MKTLGAKVDEPNLVTYLNWTPIFEWCVVRCGSMNGYQKDVFERDWTTCSKYDNHSRLNSQCNWGNLYDHLMGMRIFTFIVNMIFM